MCARVRACVCVCVCVRTYGTYVRVWHHRYANPLLDLLDPHGVITSRLFREHCAFHAGSYVKDLASLGRRLCDTFIVDNSPISYMYAQ